MTYFPHIEHAALQGQEHIRKRVRKQLWRAGMWVTYFVGLALYDGYALIQHIRGGDIVWVSVLHAALIVAFLLFTLYEIRRYLRFKDEFKEDKRFFELCPEVVQRITAMQDEARRKNLLHKMQLETERRKSKVKP